MRLCDGFIAAFKDCGIYEWSQNRGTQQPLAHWRLAGIERVEERCPVVLPGEERFNELKIPHGHLIEFECRGMFLKAQRIDVQCFVLLRGANVMQQRPGGDRGSIVSYQSKTFKRAHLELPFNKGYGEIVCPYPILNACPCRNAVENRRNLRAARQ